MSFRAIVFPLFLTLLACTGTPSGTAPDAGPIEPECRIASDCPSGFHCGGNGFCTFECRQDRDCPQGFWCDVSGRCTEPSVVPDAGPQCPSTACTVSAKECVSEAIRTCRADTEGCGTWEPPSACGIGERCEANACAPVPCREGDFRCGPYGAEKCDAGGRFQLFESCAQGCIAGVCSTVVTCEPGALRCVTAGALVQQRCAADGRSWLFEKTCATTCTAGVCDDPCSDGERRCDGDRVMACSGGTFSRVEDCPRTCRAGACLLPSLAVAGNDVPLSGEVVVAGDVEVVSGGRIVVDAAEGLTLRADRIRIDASAAIAVSPVSGGALGQGEAGKVCPTAPTVNSGGGGGGSGAKGLDSEAIRAGCNPLAKGGVLFGSDRDGDIAPGGAGGKGGGVGGGAGGRGGGRVRLVAKTITIEGEISANGEEGGAAQGQAGGGGGGGGGGILLAANQLVVAAGAKVVAKGGQGGSGAYLAPTGGLTGSATGGAGGLGRVKLLGGKSTVDASAITGVKTESLAPPLELFSSTHPDPNAWWNDGGPAWDVSWNTAFEGAAGYLWQLPKLAPGAALPAVTQANSQFSPVPALRVRLPGQEAATPPASATYTLLVASVDASARAGTVAITRTLRVNAAPPVVTSSTHPVNAFTNKTVAMFSWTDPAEGGHWPSYRYVLDRKGETVPGVENGTIVREKGLVTGELAPGWWMLHLVSLDRAQAPTRTVRRYKFGVGTAPGRGGLDVTVKSRASGLPVTGARVTLNDGLEVAAASTNGLYRLTNVYAGDYEVVVTRAGFATLRAPAPIVATQTGKLTLELDAVP